MASWMKERDRLLEQTLTFVQGVTAKRPVVTVADPIAVPPPETLAAPAMDAAPATGVNGAGRKVVDRKVVDRKIVDESSAETDALISLMAMSRPGDVQQPHGAPPEPIAVADPPQPIRVAAKASVYQPAIRRPIDSVLPERELIAQRVARFRAAQQKTLEERETSYEAAQAKIRATLGNDPHA